MQDEGCTTYGSGNAASYFYKFVIHFTDPLSDIDQMTLGHQFLLSTFGARPTKGWQIGRNIISFYFLFYLIQ